MWSKPNLHLAREMAPFERIGRGDRHGLLPSQTASPVSQWNPRRVSLGGITCHPDSCWMEQVARNATMQDTGYLNGCRYLLHDRDKKFCREFRETLAAGGVQCTPIPARSPDLNAHAERWVRSIKEECLSKLILFGEKPLQRVVSNFLEHYHQERNHQGRGNLLLFPATVPEPDSRGAIRCRERLGGLLKYYSRAA